MLLLLLQCYCCYSCCSIADVAFPSLSSPLTSHLFSAAALQCCCVVVGVVFSVVSVAVETVVMLSCLFSHIDSLCQ